VITATVTFTCDICQTVSTENVSTDVYSEILIVPPPGWKNGAPKDMTGRDPLDNSILVCPSCLGAIREDL
jgi:hypothetical protein